MNTGARFVARERGTFDGDDAEPKCEPEKPVRQCGQLWESAFQTMSTDTLLYLADLAECTVAEYLVRYR